VQSNLHRLEITQNAIVRTILSLPTRHSRVEMYKSADIPPLEVVTQLHCCYSFISLFLVICSQILNFLET